MLETFAVYFSLWSIMNFSAHQSYLCSRDKVNYWGKYALIPIVLFTLIFGLRYNVGADHLSYLEIFEYAQTAWKSEAVEEGFYLITKLLNKYTADWVYFSLFALIQIYSLYYVAKDKVYIVRYIPLVLMSGYFLQWMNIMRQATVACVLLVLINYLTKKDFWKYAVVLLLCSYFLHKSALILLLLLPIAFVDKIVFVPRWIQLSCLFISIALNVSLLFYSLLDPLVYYANIFNYEASVSAISNYNSEYNYGPVALLKILIFTIVLFYSNNVRKFYKSRFCDIVFTLFFVGICFVLMFQGNHVMKRPFEYFANMELVVVPYVLSYLHDCKSNRLNRFVYLVLILSYVLLFLIMIYKSADPDSFSAFTFLWEHN